MLANKIEGIPALIEVITCVEINKSETNNHANKPIIINYFKCYGQRVDSAVSEMKQSQRTIAKHGIFL